MQRLALLAACSLLPGCGGASLYALVAVLVIVYFAQTVMPGRCPYCGAADATSKQMQPGEINRWTCDECGKEF